MTNLSWWGALAFAHRWLGIAGCLLFLLWFVSGIAMMYARMPEVTLDERLASAPPLDASAVTVSPSEAAAFAGIRSPGAVQLGTLAGRPAYRFSGRGATTIFADTLERFSHPTPAQALALARSFAPQQAQAMRYDQLVMTPDQWTLQSRQHMPLHRIAIADADGTMLYVSSVTGDVVMQTTRRERFWAYVGPVAHWLYLPVLRSNGPLWTDVIIWSSTAGCVLCLSGLLAGLLRFSPGRRFAIRGERAMSPYAGWMKWHHYAGLLFGVITLTWTFSGLLSMGPFPPLFASEGVTAAQRRAISGKAPSLDGITLQATRDAITATQASLAAKELTLMTFRSEAYWMATASSRERALISATRPETGPFARFDDKTLEAIAREAMPGVTVSDARWLQEYDSYYYSRDGARPLPVLRVRYDDPEETWMYLDPSRGSIALVVSDPDRLNRWLYHGLHSFDFPFLHNRRPLWDIVVIVLSLGGIVGVVSSMTPAWRRLRRHAARLRAWLLHTGRT